jgi:hypothetical protein
MKWLGLDCRRIDELQTFARIDTGETVVWAAKRNGYLWHATADGIHAVCSATVVVDLGHDPYPSTFDRSSDLMTCIRCQERVRRVRPKVVQQ